MNTTQSSLRHGWVSGPDGRGTLDILWTCLVTLFLGSWSALFLNLPAKGSGRTGFFRAKTRWMVVVLLFPEMVTALAAEQWRSVRQSVEDFRKLELEFKDAIKEGSTPIPEEQSASIRLNLERMENSPWTMRHAFFADMGGVILSCPDFPPFPVTAYQLNDLIAKRHIPYPNISQREIWDKNKADGFARLLTIVQIMWFLIQCISRAVQHLAITTLELSTLSFILCTIVTLFFWNHKPLDVEEPIMLPCTSLLQDIIRLSGKDLADGFFVSPLEFIDPPVSRSSLVAPFWTGFEVTFGKRQVKTKDGVNKRVPNTRTVPPRGLLKRDIFVGLLFVFAYFGIHLAAWKFVFPTIMERTLWRVANFILLGGSAVYFFAVLAAMALIEPVAKRFFPNQEYTSPVELAYKLPRWLAVLIHVPFFLTYSVARLYIIVEGFYSLRALPASSYSTVQWENFLPHMS